MKFGLIETIGAYDGRLPLWHLHVERMRTSAVRLGIDFVPPGDLHARALDVLSDHEHEVLRITLMHGKKGPEWFFDTRQRVPATDSVRLLVADDPLPRDDVPRDMKVWPREFYDGVLALARNADADDAVILDADGTVLETAVSNLFWRRNGSWHTPAATGRLLPGIARGVLLKGLHARGVPVREGRYGVADMAGADVLVVTNAIYGPRPASLLQDSTVREIGVLREIWRAALAT